jgi:rSAM/selenodomain-associated transferase 1
MRRAGCWSGWRVTTLGSVHEAAARLLQRGQPMNTSVIVFAKAPVAGLTKTRLAPALGPAGAAALAARLLRHTLAQAAAAAVGPVELCAAPDASHPALREAALACGATLGEQGEGDLGQRMHRAFERHLAQPGRALLIGTDAPALDAARLREAAKALLEHEAVFVPALDGGYALVGLRRADPRWFAGMAWSQPRVMADTRERLRAAGMRWAELAPVADIDEPADLVHLPPGWPVDAAPA